jgi:hypothetical protein
MQSRFQQNKKDLGPSEAEMRSECGIIAALIFAGYLKPTSSHAVAGMASRPKLAKGLGLGQSNFNAQPLSVFRRF